MVHCVAISLRCCSSSRSFMGSPSGCLQHTLPLALRKAVSPAWEAPAIMARGTRIHPDSPSPRGCGGHAHGTAVSPCSFVAPAHAPALAGPPGLPGGRADRALHVTALGG